MPFIFTGSAAMAAGGLALIAAPPQEAAPARAIALLGTAIEQASFWRMERRAGLAAEPYLDGRAGHYLRAARVLAVAGAAGSVLGRRSRLAAVASGAALLARVSRNERGRRGPGRAGN